MRLTTVAPSINEKGIRAPTYPEVLAYLKEQFRLIYGKDAYLESDSQDGQFLGILALAISDTNATCVHVYNSFSPKTARTDALSRNVKINGISRILATYSTVDVVLTGQVGTVINEGIVADSNGTKWLLPKSVTLPSTGTVSVTATAAVAGAILAQAQAIQSILTPTKGWQSVSNPRSAAIGQEVESDTKLRQRQALSSAIQNKSMSDGLRGALLSLPNVTRCKIIENKAEQVDSNQIPAKSICVIVYGGDSKEIARLIHLKKSMGCGLYGNTKITVLNSYNEAQEITFYRPNISVISFKLNLLAKDAYSSELETNIRALLGDYVNALDIGDKLTQNKLYGIANLNGAELSRSYEVKSIIIKVNKEQITTDYSLPFGSVAFCDARTIEIEVTNV